MSAHATLVTMARCFRENMVDELLVRLGTTPHDTLTEVETHFIHEISSEYTGRADFANLLAVITTPFSALSIPPECDTFTRTRALFYTFLKAYFSNGNLAFYYAVCRRQRWHTPKPRRRAFDPPPPPPPAPPPPAAVKRERDSCFLHELVYLMLFRLDPTVKQEVMGLALAQHAELAARLQGVHDKYKPYIHVLPRLYPRRFVRGARAHPPNTLAALGETNHNGEQPRPAPRTRPSMQAQTTKRVKRWHEPGGTRRQPAAPEPGAPRPMCWRDVPIDGYHNYVLVVLELAASVAVQLPPFLTESSETYGTESLDLLTRLLLYIPFMMQTRDLIVYEIAEMYSIITIWNPAILPTRADGLCVYLRFFTLTHLVITMLDVQRRVSALRHF
jgi:hypothetical protein